MKLDPNYTFFIPSMAKSDQTPNSILQIDNQESQVYVCLQYESKQYCPVNKNLKHASGRKKSTAYQLSLQQINVKEKFKSQKSVHLIKTALKHSKNAVAL